MNELMNSAGWVDENFREYVGESKSVSWLVIMNDTIKTKTQ